MIIIFQKFFFAFLSCLHPPPPFFPIILLPPFFPLLFLHSSFSGVADNGNGDEAVASASLKILDEESLPSAYPRVIANPELKAVEKGRNVNLMCTVTGEPPPEVTGFKKT